ncbi:MAG: response regulator transcription factor, partial [Cyanobacteria bacterium J06623_7]
MTKVLIVDDLNSIREFLKINLSSETDIEVVGLANDGRGAITQVEEHQPDIVLMDINMPGEIDGIEATEKITRRFPQSKILLLTSEDDRHQLDRALRAGSRGYILKNTSIKDIANIIRLAEKGFFQIGPIVGDWNGSLHHSVQMSASKLERDEGDLERTDAIIPHKFDYAADASRSPEMSHTISNLSSQLFRLQETIESQEDTILNLANKYSQVQEDVARQLRRDRAVDRNSGFTVYGVKP